ncbi:hypothetical protein R6Z07F_011980 [Ovis aries]
MPSGATAKLLPAIQKTWVRSLGWEDPLEKEMATDSSTLAWKIPWTEEPDAGNWRGSVKRVDICPKADSCSADDQWSRALIDRGRVLHAETVQSALTVILKLVIGGLTSIILTV